MTTAKELADKARQLASDMQCRARDASKTATVDKLHATINQLHAMAEARQGSGEPVVWMIDWPDEPELGHCFSEAPSPSGRSRPLIYGDIAPPSAQQATGSGQVLTDEALFELWNECEKLPGGRGMQYLHFARALNVTSPAFVPGPWAEARQGEPVECAASGGGCSYGPHGPKGARQCEWCGAAPPSAQQATGQVLTDAAAVLGMCWHLVRDHGAPSLLARLERAQADALAAATRAQPEARGQRLAAAMKRLDKEGPLPGMIAAFEQQFGQSWTDRDWRNETSVWACAWRAALAAPTTGKREPLMNGQIYALERALPDNYGPIDLARAVERAHGINGEQ